MLKYIIAFALLLAVLLGALIVVGAIMEMRHGRRSFYDSLAYTVGGWKKMAGFSPTPFDAQNPRMQQDWIFKPQVGFNGGVSSYGRAAHPVVFGDTKSAATYTTSNEPDMDLYGKLQEQSFREDLNAMAGTKLFKDRPLPREPITDSDKHYVGDYSEAMYDPMQDSIFRKVDNLGYAGVSIFHEH